MRRFLIILAFSFVCASSIFAQPTFSLSSDSVNPNDLVVLQVTVNDFSSLTETNYSINWDDTKLEFQSVVVTSALSGFDYPSSFDVTQTNVGKLGVHWLAPNQETGGTLDDGSMIFELRFTAKGCDVTTEVLFSDDPIPQWIVRNSSMGGNIEMFGESGFVEISDCLFEPLNIDIGSGTVNEGDEICIPLIVENFSQTISFQFSINWDPTILEFVGITNLASPSMSPTDFNLESPGNGISIWYTSMGGLSIPDGSVLYEICFKALAPGVSDIVLSSTPSPIEFLTLDSEPTNIGINSSSGTVTVEEVPFNGVWFNMTNEVAELGEEICIDVAVTDFTNIVSTQYSFEWDPNVLQYIGVQNFNLPGLSSANFSNYQEGLLLNTWNAGADANYTLADGTVIFQMCFIVIGSPGSSTDIEITDEYDVVEITNTFNPGEDIGAKETGGIVNVVSSPPEALGISGTTHTVNTGDEVCVSYSVSEFEFVNQMSFTLSWDPNILQLNSPGGITNFGLAGLSITNFDISQSANGLIGVNWTDPSGQSLSNGTVIFDVCFTFIGEGGSGTVIGFTNQVSPILVTKLSSGSTDVGINNINGIVNSLDPSQFSIELDADNDIGFPGTQICLDVEVGDFSLITSFEATIEWDETIVSFDHLTGFVLDGLDASDFNVSMVNSGVLGVSWDSPNPDGTTIWDISIFQICFNLVGNIGDHTDIVFTNSLNPLKATNQQLGNQNIGINPHNGSIDIVEQPEDFSIYADTSWINQGDLICIDYKVNNFNELFSFQFTIQWDPGILQFYQAGINQDNPGFTNGIFGTTQAQSQGYLTVLWTDSQLGGVTLEDGTVLFTLCYTAIGPVGSVTEIDINSSHLPVEIINNNLLSPDFIYTPNTVYIVETLSLENAEVNQVNCSGPNSGSIEVTVENGIEPIHYQWNTSPADTFALIENLPEGQYSVTVYDSATEPDSLILTYTLIDLNDGPISVPGDAFTFDCEHQILEIGTEETTQGSDFIYYWSTTDGEIISGETTLFAVTQTVGTYSLIVTDTVKNCSDTASVFVDGEIYPIPLAGEDMTLCENNATLGTNLPLDVWGEWSTNGSAIIETPLDSETSVMNLQDGRNRFYLTVSTDGCEDYATDTVDVFVSGTPIANPDYFVVGLNATDFVLAPQFNDVLTNVDNYSLTVMTTPQNGVVDNNSGYLTYSPTPNFIGEDYITYQICNEDCPEKCSESFINLSIQYENSDTTGYLPNAITPNDDGVNDELIFDELLYNYNSYPDNELMIFNRWGDIVYRAKPYLNDWKGVTNSNKNLPEATYYYILNLNINEGKIFRGDITIIR